MSDNENWTLDTLCQYLKAEIAAADLRYSQRYEAQDKAVQAALVAQEKAVTAALTASDRAVEKAEVNAEKWRMNANEWRQAMNDRESKFMPRLESDRLMQLLADKLVDLANRMERREGQEVGTKLSHTGTVSNVQLMFGAIMVLLAIASLYFVHK